MEPMQLISMFMIPPMVTDFWPGDMSLNNGGGPAWFIDFFLLHISLFATFPLFKQVVRCPKIINSTYAHVSQNGGVI